MTKKLIYQEDDALVYGRDPDYRGIHEWWEREFGRKFSTDYDAAENSERDHGDSFTRTICIAGRILEVTYDCDHTHSVREVLQ